MHLALTILRSTALLIIQLVQNLRINSIRVP